MDIDYTLIFLVTCLTGVLIGVIFMGFMFAILSDDTKELCLAAQGTYIDGECYKNVERLPL